MPRVTLIQTNFTAGEISPRCYGRVDIARYQNGAEIIENAFPLIHGGAVRRFGFRYVATVKDSSKRTRLIGYVFNVEQSYVVEAGENYLRFYTDSGQIPDPITPANPYEIASPYDEAQVFELDWSQGADTMFVTHSDFKPYRLRRFQDANWTMDPAPFLTEPFAEVGTYPAAALTLGSAAVGATTATAGAAVFLASDVGRQITYQGGVATITGYTSTTVVNITISTAFPGTAIASGAWNLTLSPQTTCTPSAKDPVGASITLTLGAAGWRAEDVGKYVDINAGLCKITGFTSDTVVNATIVTEIEATVASPALAWLLEGSMWGGVYGYPRAVTLFEQRLWLGGSPGFPQQVWGSVTAEYLDFTLGTLDTDAVSFPIASDQLNPIRHLSQVKTLLALTYGGEFSLQGGNEKPITPLNVQIKNQSVYGCNAVLPVRIGNELLFVQRAGKKVRAMSPDRYDISQYGAPDLSALAEHITESGIVDAEFLQEPDPLHLCVRGDGKIASLSIDRDQDVIAWARQFTNGTIESVAVIPVAGGEQLWAIIARQINGTTVRTIEIGDWTLNTDCALTGTSVGGSATWSVPHLKGCTVDVLADGIDMGTFVVDAVTGLVTLPRIAYAVEIGLNFVTRVKTLTPEIPTSTGSVQGQQMSCSEVVLTFLNTIGAKIDGKDCMHRNLGVGVLDTPPDPFTGPVSLSKLGWAKGRMQLEITQDRPYPFHLQGVIKTFTADG